MTSYTKPQTAGCARPGPDKPDAEQAICPNPIARREFDDENDDDAADR